LQRSAEWGSSGQQQPTSISKWLPLAAELVLLCLCLGSCLQALDLQQQLAELQQQHKEEHKQVKVRMIRMVTFLLFLVPHVHVSDQQL
jgi:hypothetical protein